MDNINDGELSNRFQKLCLLSPTSEQHACWPSYGAQHTSFRRTTRCGVISIKIIGWCLSCFTLYSLLLVWSEVELLLFIILCMYVQITQMTTLMWKGSPLLMNPKRINSSLYSSSFTATNSIVWVHFHHSSMCCSEQQPKSTNDRQMKLGTSWWTQWSI